ncbi:MAG: carbon starvation protein A [Candidatus Omnitrophica bacterium]|nr:carbon starvation protein A [Candidatus Omnitrophota bacterium]
MFIFILVLFLLLLGYIFYGKLLSNLFEIDYNRLTPAVTKEDGVDFIPAKSRMVIFGHHFASIAGAGPIVGPVFAYLYWGWVGALLWIVLGSIFMGAVQDFSTLIVSLREGGSSIAEITSKYISPKARVIFIVFVIFSLIIVIAVFADICVKSFINERGIIIPSLGLIPVAIIVGLLMYNLKFHTFLSTFLGLAMLIGLIFLGKCAPLQLNIVNPYLFWMIVILTYAFFASVIPVNILLQPRDYISSFLLFFSIAVAFLGIVIKPLPIGSGYFFRFSSPQGTIFPLMFITVACGSISGFHSLVSSGTTSKQLSSEKDALSVGYGGMILEAILATIALLCVVFGLKSTPQDKTPTELFSLGFSQIVFFLGDYGQFIALLILNTFILTTLDTATRITRLLTEELLGIKNKYLSTLLIISLVSYFCLKGTWQVLWPIFGASNQLVAAIALLVVSAYLINKKKSFKVTLIPSLIMFVITISALFIKMVGFFKENNYLLSFLSFILIILGLFIVEEFRRLKNYVS